MVARALSILAGFALVATATAPVAAAPLRLAPTSDWQLRAYDDKCRMIREFGEGEDAMTLWIDKGGPGPGVNLTLIGRAVRSPYGAYVRVGFAPGEPVERNFITANSSKGRPVLGLFGVVPVSLLAESAAKEAAPATDAEESVDFAQAAATEFADEATLRKRFAAIEALELSGGVIDPVTLELDRFLPMSDDLMKCAMELTKRLSQDLVAAGGKRVEPVDQQIWAAKIQENYPAHLARTGQQGTVAVRLTINKQGSPTFCEVTANSGPVSFNDTACLQLLRHARFSPATNADGEPVASFWSTRITYKLT
jgi:TonB family protein